MIGDLQMAHLACAQLASIEQKEHFLFGIPMVGHLENLGNFHLDATLLLAFADQGLLGRLPLFELATRELPQARQMLPLCATGEEHTAVSDDHRGSDDNQA
jgi:hypothetical protein